MAQTDREIYKSLGQTQADIAGAGFAQGGSALDLLRDSASQGAVMRAAARLAAETEENAATAATWSAGIKAVGGRAVSFNSRIASLLPS